MAQASLSLQLQRLTPAGEAFQREAQGLFGQLELTVEAARWASSGSRGQVRLGSRNGLP
jgi:DNA-binding transcriptional LysR family regulator